MKILRREWKSGARMKNNYYIKTVCVFLGALFIGLLMMGSASEAPHVSAAGHFADISQVEEEDPSEENSPEEDPSDNNSVKEDPSEVDSSREQIPGEITAEEEIPRRVTITKISNVSGSRRLVLHWKSVRGAVRYQIVRKKAGSRHYRTVATVKGKKVSYTDKKLTGGRVYTYKVCAWNGEGVQGEFGRAVSQMAIDKNKKMIALTYDDGPSRYTPTVLRALEKYQAHATFYVVGSCVKRYPATVRKVFAAGNEIGNHTYNHENLTRRSAGQIKSVLGKTNHLVKRQTGRDICTVRPPGGNYNTTVKKAAGMPLILWSLDTLDWRTRSTSATVRSVLGHAGDGAIVLMHDLHESTAKAADKIIGTLKGRGYQMVTVSELAAYRGGMRAGTTYSRFLR